MSTSAIDLRSDQDEVTPQSPPLRFVTAASLFDGHDAAINVMRRLIQAAGAEVIHLGHNRSVADVVRTAIQEDADGIAVSSYQGGHLEYFKYAVDMLREQGAGHIRVFGGGGGTITPSEAAELEAYGVERVYLPGDGQQLGLEGMIADLIERTARVQELSALPAETAPGTDLTIARMLSALEDEVVPEATRDQLRARVDGGGRGRPRRRHHRHGRSGQEHRHRRARLALPPVLPRRADRGARGRSDAAPHRWRAARRPDQDEQPARRAGVHALAGDAPAQRGDERGPRGRGCAACAPRASISSSSRRPGSARATPRSSTSSTSRST